MLLCVAGEAYGSLWAACHSELFRVVCMAFATAVTGFTTDSLQFFGIGEQNFRRE